MDIEHLRIGIDIGGTFTDLVSIDESGLICTAKTLSTPEDPSLGVMTGLELLAKKSTQSLSSLLKKTTLLIHGTTVATNLLVERKGAKLAMISTEGFRDILELREGTKANRYNLRTPFPQPLIPRPMRHTIKERVGWSGLIKESLNLAELETALKELRQHNVEGLVVCFLHSHRNPSHEIEVRKLVKELGWKVFVSLSHEVLSREGEYDRASTATVNAYVGPGLQGYLSKLERRLEKSGLNIPLLVMQSTGGVLPILEAGQLAGGSINSGPAGGAMAAGMFSAMSEIPLAVSYDMGGTSTDICLIKGSVPLERHTTEFEDVKIAVPTLDISALGAGGGSIAHLDRGGILDLGPSSAGADPGPACYGKGGLEPTLTDANLILGYISTETFLGGELSLSIEDAQNAIQERISKPLNLAPELAAIAINALASSRIAEGIRAATVRRGLDPRDFSLFAFGGASGLHAEAVINELSIPRAIIPREASVLSAIGFLSTDVRRDYHRSVGRPISDLDANELRSVFTELEAEAKNNLEAQGFDSENMKLVHSLDCRYARQVYTVNVRAYPSDFECDELNWLTAEFETTYKNLFQHIHDTEPGFIDTCNLTIFGTLPRLALPKHEIGDLDPGKAQKGERNIFISEWLSARVYWFEELSHGMRVQGPAVIDSPTTSVLISPDGVAEVDAYGSLHLYSNL
ncbi:MAG: 5-oxoprolinase [Magnetovibrio sp.]|nr:5-oxoprolinase [Magnetovibrio sp.]